MVVSGTFHLVGYGWNSDRFVLRLRSWPNGDIVEEIDPQGFLRFRRLEERQCAGFYDFERKRRFTCPERTVSKKKQCEACLEREGFLAWMRSDGYDIPALKPAVRSYIEGEHFLYLACFGDETVKVGMASAARKTQRLLDQGPLSAIYVAKADGIAIRRLEVEVSQFGYSEFMRRSRKFKLLSEAMSVQDGHKLLAQSLRDIKMRVSEEFHSHFLAEPESFISPPAAVVARSFHRLEECDPSEGKIVEGEVVAASGSILILNDAGVRYGFDVGEWVSHVFEFDPKGKVEREAKQIGLF